MASIAKLAVSLTANTAAFSKGMEKAGGALRRFGATAMNAIKPMVKWGSVLAGAATAATTLAVRQQLKYVDAIAKTADRLGIATEELVSLHRAAKLTGADTQILDKGLRNMMVKIAQAADRTSEASYALATLGIRVEDIIQLAPAKQFRVIADAMNRLGDTTLKARVAYELFGGRATALINTLNLGSAGLDKMRAEAERLGLTFSRMDAARIEKANDAITDLKAVLAASARIIAVDLAPYVELATKRITEWAVAATSAGGIIGSAFGGVGKAIGAVADAVNFLKIGLGQVALWFNEVIERAMTATAWAIEKIQKAHNWAQDLTAGPASVRGSKWVEGQPRLPTDWTKGIDKELADLRLFIGKLDMELTDAVNAAKPSETLAEILAAAKRQADMALEAFNATQAAKAAGAQIFLGGPGWMGPQSNALEQAKKQQDAWADSLKRAMENAKAARTPFEIYTDKIEELNKQLGVGLLTWTEYERLTKSAAGAFKAAMTPAPLPAAALMGSREAYSAIVNANRPNVMEDLTRDMRNGDRERNRILTRMEELLENPQLTANGPWLN